MPLPRARRFSKKEQFRFVLQALRYALANRIPLFRVVEVRPKPVVPPGYPPVQIVIEMYGFPLAEGRRVKRPVSARRLAEFFRDWKVQEEFLKWHAKLIAASIPANSSLAGLKRSLSRLTVGRHGKLPPSIYLRSEYQTLVAEIKLLQERFGNQARLPIEAKQSHEMLRFGRVSNAKWVEFVKRRRIYLDELFKVPPETGAKLILSKQYSSTEDSIHSRLHRST